MPDQNTDAEAKLKKLGHHLRLGWQKQQVTSEKSLETVRGAVREQWQKEREEKLAEPPAPDATREKGREPEEPDLGR
jgi:hypothetical protein